MGRRRCDIFFRPAAGPVHDFAVGTVESVDKAAEKVEAAFASFGWPSRADRAALLRKAADEIDARGDAITEFGTLGTGLPEARLACERGRKTGLLAGQCAEIWVVCRVFYTIVVILLW